MENTTSATPSAPPSNGWKVMGILAVVLGGLSILFSFIPCLGQYAMYSGGFSTILSVIALVMANSAKAAKTLAIIGLVISLLSVGIGYWQHTNAVKVGSAITTGLDKMKNDLDSTRKADSAKNAH